MDKPRSALPSTRLIISDAVRRHWGLVAKQKGIDAEDITSHFIVKLVESEEEKFDEWWSKKGSRSPRANEEGAWSNFLNMLVYRRMMDMGKVNGRERKRVLEHLSQWEWGWESNHGHKEARTTRIVYDEPINYDEPVEEEFEGIVVSDTSAGDQTLYDWTRNFYVRAKRAQTVPADGKWSHAQLVVCGLLMLRLAYDPQQIRQLLQDRTDLRIAVEINEIPGLSWFERAEATVLAAAGNI